MASAVKRMLRRSEEAGLWMALHDAARLALQATDEKKMHKAKLQLDAALTALGRKR